MATGLSRFCPEYAQIRRPSPFPDPSLLNSTNIAYFYPHLLRSLVTTKHPTSLNTLSSGAFSNCSGDTKIHAGVPSPPSPHYNCNHRTCAEQYGCCKIAAIGVFNRGYCTFSQAIECAKGRQMGIRICGKRWFSAATFPQLPSRVSNIKNISNSTTVNSVNIEFPVGVIHAKAIKDATFHLFHISNYILSLYIKSGTLVNARQLFDEIPDRDVRSWTILISGFSRVGSYKPALNLFTQMQKEGISPNLFTFSSVLKCCSSLNELRMGQSIHGWIICNAVGLDVTLENAFLDFYVKCGEFDYAKRLFENMPEKDVVSWNIMMGAYLQIGDMENSRDLFNRSPVKDAASWNTIIDGHMRNGRDKIALELLYQMVNVGPAFTEVTLSIALVLASSLTIVELGRQIHGRVLRGGLLNDGFIRNSLIDMYCKCGLLEKANLIFQTLPRNARTQYSKATREESISESLSKSSIITGYVQNGKVDDAFQLFRCMLCEEEVSIDKFTLTSMLSACANAGVLELGLQIHAYITKTGQDQQDEFLGASMIDMYAKCGRLDDSWSVFVHAKMRNIVSWTSLISGYAMHGQGREAIRVFEMMLNEGITPNEVSFVGVLNACSHAGLINEGCNYFRVMKEVYKIKPQVEHFTCMVDLFGRAGRLEEIEDFINKNDVSHVSAVWRAFLSSCRVHKNIVMGRRVCNKLLELEPLAAAPYVLFSNACASDDRWDEAAAFWNLMQGKGVEKQPGHSWI